MAGIWNSTETSRDSGLPHQQGHLRELLQHAWTHSPFYRDFYGSHGIREKDLSEIAVTDLPFLSKQLLMENFDKVVADPRLKKEKLEQWIQEVHDPGQLYHDEFVVIHSSGYSGTLGIFVYDLRTWRAANTTVARHFPRPESTLEGKTRIASYFASHGHFGAVTSTARLPRSVYDVLMVSILDAPEHVAEQLNAFQPHRLSGYSSGVALLAELAINGDLNIHPQNVVVSADLLTPAMEQKIQDAWHAPLYNLYAASESLYLAIKVPTQQELVVMDALNILEILSDNNDPVLPGKVGRAVLTNLYNHLFPILRYELGDYMVRGEATSDSQTTTIRNIQGRANDALPVMLDNGREDAIHALVLSEFYASGLQKVQFVSSRPDHVEISYIAKGSIDDAVGREFQRLLELKGARRTTFQVQKVDHIANDPRSGKFVLVRLEGKGKEITSSRP
jgi:phenylacetate-CoA ligase